MLPSGPACTLWEKNSPPRSVWILCTGKGNSGSTRSIEKTKRILGGLSRIEPNDHVAGAVIYGRILVESRGYLTGVHLDPLSRDGARVALPLPPTPSAWNRRHHFLSVGREIPHRRHVSPALPVLSYISTHFRRIRTSVFIDVLLPVQNPLAPH